MKVVITEKYGGAEVLKLKEIPKPQISNDEVLVKVVASSVNPYEIRIRRGEMKIMTGKKPPQVLGSDFAGVVEEIGSGVNNFKKGDEVFGMLDGLKGGSYAEYLKVKTGAISLKPTNLNFEEAASIPLVALTSYRSIFHIGKVRKGDNVLINGCTGGVGSSAVQIAKALGCTVAGVCSTKNIEFAKSLGVDNIIDYKKEDVTKLSVKYDLIFDTIGNIPFSKSKAILKPGKIYVTTNVTPAAMMIDPVLNIFRNKKAKIVMVSPNADDLNEIKKHIEAGKVKPQINTTFLLDQIQEAHYLSETGRVTGKIVLKIQ
ncbi:MAG: NAD(P)-dependent alcohol dehydrogenase [Candidatus Cloacimonetes bacterium]|nr:NAD(P)-dependent alcohol dehydrogenase [Candidatus Cloacimonadota bacterium]